MIPFGREFFKMSGSGNDFVFVDGQHALYSVETTGNIAHTGQRDLYTFTLADASCRRPRS